MNALLWLAAAWAGEVNHGSEGHALHPTWSPDGRTIAFEVSTLSGGDASLFVADVADDSASGASRVSLPGGPAGQVVMGPVWLGGGFFLFEGSNHGGNYRVFYRSQSGGAASELVHPAALPGDLAFPTGSSDNQTIVLLADGEGGEDLWARDTATSKLRQLTHTPRSELFPTFSPDDTHIVFARRDGDDLDLFRVPVAGGAEERVVSGPGDQSRPVFAGRTLLYFDDARAHDQWDLVAVLGDARETLAHDVRLPHRARPAVSPDGRWVGWTSGEPAEGCVVTFSRVDGSQVVTVDTPHLECSEPAITEQDGRTLLAYTAWATNEAEWRSLHVVDITDQLAPPSAASSSNTGLRRHASSGWPLSFAAIAAGCLVPMVAFGVARRRAAGRDP